MGGRFSRLAVVVVTALLFVTTSAETASGPIPWSGGILAIWYAKDNESTQVVSENCYADYHLGRRKVEFKYDYSYTSFGEMTFHQDIPLVERTANFYPNVEVTFDRPNRARVTYSPYTYLAKGTQGATRTIPWAKEVFCEPRVVDGKVTITSHLKIPRCGSHPSWPPCAPSWVPATDLDSKEYFVEIDGVDKAVIDVGEHGHGTLITSVALYLPCRSVPAAFYLGCPPTR
jgi:hypothetical protein